MNAQTLPTGQRLTLRVIVCLALATLALVALSRLLGG